MNGGAWWATVHGVAKSQTQLSKFTFTFHFHALENGRRQGWDDLREWQLTPVFLPGKFHRQRSPAGTVMGGGWRGVLPELQWNLDETLDSNSILHTGAREILQTLIWPCPASAPSSSLAPSATGSNTNSSQSSSRKVLLCLCLSGWHPLIILSLTLANLELLSHFKSQLLYLLLHKINPLCFHPGQGCAFPLYCILIGNLPT